MADPILEALDNEEQVFDRQLATHDLQHLRVHWVEAQQAARQFLAQEADTGLRSIIQTSLGLKKFIQGRDDQSIDNKLALVTEPNFRCGHAVAQLLLALSNDGVTALNEIEYSQCRYASPSSQALLAKLKSQIQIANAGEMANDHELQQDLPHLSALSELRDNTSKGTVISKFAVQLLANTFCWSSDIVIWKTNLEALFCLTGNPKLLKYINLLDSFSAKEEKGFQYYAKDSSKCVQSLLSRGLNFEDRVQRLLNGFEVIWGQLANARDLYALQNKSWNDNSSNDDGGNKWNNNYQANKKTKYDDNSGSGGDGLYAKNNYRNNGDNKVMQVCMRRFHGLCGDQSQCKFSHSPSSEQIVAGASVILKNPATTVKFHNFIKKSMKFANQAGELSNADLAIVSNLPYIGVEDNSAIEISALKSELAALQHAQPKASQIALLPPGTQMGVNGYQYPAYYASQNQYGAPPASQTQYGASQTQQSQMPQPVMPGTQN